MRNTPPPVKVAVLIDGGFFVKRFNALYNKDRLMTGDEVAQWLYRMAHMHVGRQNTLYRIFYYDCLPLGKKMHNPISKRSIDFSRSEEYRFRTDLIEALKRKRKVALRIGTLKASNEWCLYPRVLKALLSGDSDFVPAAKLARREGIDFILDPMKANVDPQLFEHIDGMKHCQPKIVKGSTANNGQ